MSTSPTLLDLRPVIARIDAIIRELEALRRQLTMPAMPVAPDLAAPIPLTRPALAEVRDLIGELRGRYAAGRSLTQALLNERRQEREREDARARRYAASA